MSWFPWSESIKKRVCRYLLHHYLGHFLQQNLHYDQLSVDLYNGAGCVENVQLNVFALNETVQKFNAPIDILEGSVQSISLIIPWKNIFKESCVIEVKGIRLIVQPKYMPDADLADMTDSLYSSFQNMTTSMQLAQECLNDTEKQGNEGNLFEGLEVFAQSIENILRRIKLKFGEITLCFEHLAPSATVGVGLELNIAHFEYFDEDSDKTNEMAVKDKNASVVEKIAFSCKQFCMSGIGVSLYQFCGNRQFGDFQNDININESATVDPIKVAQLFGEQQIKVRIRETDHLSGPKIDAEIYLGNCAAFLSPKQVRILLDFVDGFVTPSSSDSNYTSDSMPSVSPPVANNNFSGRNSIDPRPNHVGSYNSSHTRPSKSKVQFYPLSYSPNESLDAFKSTVEHFNVCSLDDFQPAGVRPKTRSCTDSLNENSSVELRVKVQVVGLSLTVLHVDPTGIPSAGYSRSLNQNNDLEDQDSHRYMLELVKTYFSSVRKAFESYALIELFQNRQLFTNAANLHDHIRALAGPLHVECEREVSTQKSSLVTTRVNASVGNAELLECLNNDDKLKQNNASCQCVELLVFPSFLESGFRSLSMSAIKKQSIKLSMRFADSIDLYDSLIDLELADCKSEIDVSIIDRFSELMYCFDIDPRPASTNVSGNYSATSSNFVNHNALYQKILDDENELKRKKIDFDVSSSKVEISFRFPIPDLRPEMQRRPWFERMLRDEVLHLVAKDIDCKTSISGCDEESRLVSEEKVVKCRFRQLLASYSDEVDKPPKAFLRTCQCHADQMGPKNDYDLPYAEIRFQKRTSPNQLCSNDDSRAPLDETMYFSHTAYGIGNDIMFNSYYEPSNSTIPSPFTKRRVTHNNEEMVLPGEEKEIIEFIDHVKSSSKVTIGLNLPVLHIGAPSKSFIESIYNRFSNDLLLWEPAAPQPSIPVNNEVNIPPRLDLESQFFSTNSNFGEITIDKKSMHVSFMTDDDDNDDVTSASFLSRSAITMNKSSDKLSSQTLLSLSLNINQGSLSLCSDVASEDNKSQTGQVFIELKNGTLFTATQYLGNPNVDYVCVLVDSCSVHHKIGILSAPVMEDNYQTTNIPAYLNSIIYPHDKGVAPAFDGRNSSSNQKMITVVVKLETEEKRDMKQCCVASLLHGLTLRHQFLPVGHSFWEQLIDIFDVKDTPVLGYKPPAFLTEVHFHLNDCAIDYKPLHINTRAIATIGSFALSSNVAANSPQSVLQIIMDYVNIYLSDNCSERHVDLRQNFVNVLTIGLLELGLKLRSREYTSNKKSMEFPDLELTISNGQLQMWTCADSCALLAALIRYIADDGDIVMSEAYSEEQTLTSSEDEIDKTIVNDEDETELTKPSYELHLENLLLDAAQELSPVKRNNFGRTVVEFPSNSDATYSSTVEDESRSLSDFEEDFCIIDDENIMSNRIIEPTVEYLFDNGEEKVVIVENHFAPVTGRTDQLKAPDHFPVPVVRYTVRELSCSWYMYGGNDFANKDATFNTYKDKETFVKLDTDLSKRSPHHIDKKPGGVSRDHKVLMEFHMTKARFQHELYKPDEMYAARTVFTVTNFEIHDRLQSSQINKFLYHFHNETSPKQSHANMLLIKALLVRSEKNKDPECRLKISLQPLRLNIDQDALNFLTTFFNSLSSGDDSNTSFDDGSTYGTAPSTFAEPQLEVKHFTNGEVDSLKSTGAQSSVVRPLFFNEFIFSPAVPIRLDYRGKRIDIEQGKIAGLLMGLGQLNCSQLRLQKIVHRHGLLGVDKLINFALNEWAADIRNNQLPSILGGVGPLHSFVQFFQGFRDLVWLPVEQYRRDGRIVRGLQRGTSSFGTSTSMAMLELTNRFVWLVQTTAETACDIVSPADVHRNREKYLNSWHGLAKQAKRRRQPSDLREGFNNAVSLVHHGVTDTAYSIARVAQQEHERKGLTGAVGGVIRHIPLTLVRPVVIASEATSNVLSGMRNQILPDARREDEDKWRLEPDDG